MGTNLGGLAAYDPSWLRTGVGKLFIIPSPTPASEVGKVTVTAGGTAYVDGTAVTFSGGGATRQAQGVLAVAAGVIQKVIITDPGAGYTSAPTCTPTGGTGATLTPSLGVSTGPLRWLVPPTTPVFADYIEGWMQRFYEDPTTCKTLNRLLSPWSFLTAEGFKPKFNQEGVEIDPADGPKFTIGAADLLVGGEFTFADVSPDRWADCLSTPAGNQISLAAAAGKAGRNRVGIGAERVLNKYALCYRMPSPKYTGEFDHLIIPRATMVVNADPQFAKNKPLEVKISFSAQAEPSLISPVNGELLVAFWDYATAPAQ